MTRARQTSIDIGRCRHETREPVYAQGGHQIAIRCRGCTTILAHIGMCEGCGLKDAELFCLVASRRKRFCDVRCYDRWQERRRQERQQAPVAEPTQGNLTNR